MRRYLRLAEDERPKRRTVADALAVLQSLPAFSDRAKLRLAVHPLRLPSGKIVGLVDLEYHAGDDLVFVASLATSTKFHAARQAASQREEFDIFRLDKASAEAGNASVTLADGTSLRSVEVIPARLPYRPSELEQRIIYRFVEMRGAQDRCFPRLSDRTPPAFRKFVPEHICALDCQALAQLEPPLLKVFASYLMDHDSELSSLSSQKLADALANFGVRPIKPRPRKKHARVLP